MDKAGYYVALEGVTRHGLSEAVKAILKGALNHGFFPSPPELRKQCDKAMEWHEEMARRIRRREREDEDFQRLHGSPPPRPTPEGKARVSRAYAKFCTSYEKQSAEETFRLDPELVALVPNNPKAGARQRMGKDAA